MVLVDRYGIIDENDSSLGEERQNLAKITNKENLKGDLSVAIKNADVSELSGKVNIDVDIQNLNAEEKTYIVIAGLYDGNKMVGSDAEAFESASAEKAQLSIKPEENSSIVIGFERE